jgi:hypothetical protein
MPFARVLITLVAILIVAPAAQGAAPRSYVQIIVKACPAIEQTGQDHKPDAVMAITPTPLIRA